MTYQLFPMPHELARELILAWVRVGYEALGLLAYVNGSTTNESPANSNTLKG